MNNDFDIAIVGMSCRLPGARNVEEFWRNLAGGIESIPRLSDEEILSSGVPSSYLGNPSYVKAAPILDGPGEFDAGFFGFSPMEAKTMDPQHRVLLELAYEALENAGYDADRYQGRIGVFTGAAMNTYFMEAGLKTQFAEAYIPTLIGNDKDFLSTRISYKLNLKGPSITVQTACSTSMVAVHLARQSLLSEETDMALAGAISIRVPHRAGYFCDGGGVVSADGHVRAFDANANGTVFGSGGGILVLKRLADALSAGDTIHAVIKGSAVNNDGSEKAGYTAPSVNSQADAVVEALANAGVEADSISYIEAHGSGTPVGDPIEIRALTKAFRMFTQRSGYCAIGSVKTNVGHLDAAAAVTGIIKTVLALKHRQIPPTLHFREANPEIDFPNTPFFVNTQMREWANDGPRRAGVMSTGMGGTNAHLVLEEAPEIQETVDPSSAQLLVLSARTETALDLTAGRLREFLDRNESVNLSDVAYTLGIGRKAFPYRRTLVCAHREEAITALGQADSKRVLSNRLDDSQRSVVFLLPGIGDHYVGMAHDLYETQNVFRQEVDRCADILKSHLGRDIRNILYPVSKSWKRASSNGSNGIDLKKMLGRKTDALEDEDTRELSQTEFAQPAMFTIEYAMSRLWQSLGVNPEAIIGHSMGEYVAACLAGVFSLDDALRLIATRARLVAELPQGGMLAVLLPENKLLPLLSEDLSISLINGPDLCVVAGPIAAVAEFENKLNAGSILSRQVQNGHAFHSRMLDPIAKVFEQEVSKIRLKEPTIPFTSNVTGTWIKPSEATNPGYWVTHARQTARFNDALHQMWQLDNPILLEVGPGRTLIALAQQHPGSSRAGKPVTVSSLRPHYESGSDIEFLRRSCGMLWLSGIDLKWETLYQSERRRRIPLPTYPFERQNHWLESVVVPDAPSQTKLSIQRNPNPSEWLYVQSWKRLLPKSATLRDLSLQINKIRKWLFFADDLGFSAALINKLRSADHDVVTVRFGSSFQQTDPRSFTIEPSNFQHYERLIHALRMNGALPDHIVHAWSVTRQNSAESSADGFAQAQELGFYSLLFLAKALATNNVGEELSLFALSNNAQEVCGNEILCPQKSTLMGPSIVIRQEYPNIRSRSIDVDVSEDPSDHESTAELLLGEFFDSSDSSLFVAYRNSQRWVQIYEPVSMENPVLSATSFREGGVYLITGGLGKVGMAISEHLARNYQARIVMVGRSGLPEKKFRKAWLDNHSADDPISERVRAIERLEELGGEVLYMKADVGDLNAMRAVVEQSAQHFGVLHGVIHGAGIVGDEGYLEIKDSNFAACDRHFQAKAHGLTVLEEVLDGKELDFCLLLSSLASVLGGLGQAAYASANIFMDTLARKHNRSSSVPWLSVNWDVWRGLDEAAIESGLGTTLKELGMSAEEATNMMATVLAMKNVSHLVVSTGDLSARINQWTKLESLNNSRVASAARPTQSNIFQGDKTEQRIAQIWQDTLGIEHIGIHESFVQLGGHSLLGIRIIAELRKAFGINLSVRALFDAPTVAELASYIKSCIIAKIEALTEEETQLLLANEQQLNQQSVW